jgi:hypothetical protein
MENNKSKALVADFRWRFLEQNEQAGAAQPAEGS